jgi:hypothetical protein
MPCSTTCPMVEADEEVENECEQCRLNYCPWNLHKHMHMM